MKTAIPESLLPEFFRLGRMPFVLDAYNIPVNVDEGSPAHAAARRILEEKDSVVDLVSEAVCRAYNYDAVFSEEGLEKCRRDLRHVVDFLALCLAMDRHTFFEDRMLYWFRRVLSHLSFPCHRDSIRAAYTILRQEFMVRLGKVHRDLAEPYFNALLIFLADDTTLEESSE